MQIVDGQAVYAATDLVGYLACRHRFALERAALAGLVARPERTDPEIELIRKRGYEHEARYRAELEASGRTVVEIQPDGYETDQGARLRAAAEATRRALESGADVVYQATFFDGRWRGHADFLLRVDRPSRLGAWSYEVADTKLARRVKGSAVLQICSYVEQLVAIQGAEPERLHVVLGGSARERVSLRVADYMAYYRSVKAGFEAAVASEAAVYPVTASYPDPVEHCDVCRWAAHCDAQRRRDDDLSLVAGISARQRAGLKGRGIATRRGLASLALPLSPPLERLGAVALARVRDQARIQVEGEDDGRPRYELLQPERDVDGRLVPDRGLLALPEPSDNDLFFDIEGDPFALEDGVEYLFGVLEPARRDPTDERRPLYHEIWSRDPGGEVTRAAEKAAFERLVDLLVDRWRAAPSLHVYHYAAYERAALGRLAQRHATREAEVDELLRAGVLVDLFRVVRQALRASVESYSIKQLEPLYGFRREVELRTAGSSIVQFETWLEGGTAENGAVGEAILQEIAGYNRDDVASNWRLRNWLEALRWELEAMIDERPGRPAPPAAEPEPAPAVERDRVAAELAASLTTNVPAEPGAGTPEQRGRWLLAQLLGWHRREEKSFWWRYYQLCGMTDEALVDEREPMGEISLVADLGPAGKGGRLERYAFPRQDHGLREGRTVHGSIARAAVGRVEAIDETGLTIDLRRSRAELERGTPTSLIPFDFVPSDGLQESLQRIARWVIANGITGPGPYRAARELLLRHPPPLADVPGAPLRRSGESAPAAAVRLALALGESTLAIQGPPGSGKTTRGAEMVVELVRAGRRVGVAANSHKVISHLLDAIPLASGGTEVRLGQRRQEDDPACAAAESFDGNPAARAALDAGRIDVLGGTAWAWSSEALAGAVDVLVIDEAGQLSLANAVAMSPATGGLILLGDPQQLDQPLKGSHPPGAERSALGHLLEDRPTLREAEGLFLDRTWRLHPDVCRYTSELFYENQLEPGEGLERQDLAGVAPADGTGVRWLPIVHAGNAIEAPEEAVAITRLVGELLAAGPTWTDREGVVRQLLASDILVVAPYNAHVELLREALAEAGHRAIDVGTVDKFQGQQAVVSIYAMASSSAEDAPRGMEFLYSLHRLNVATSRARCAALVVASPELVRVECRTAHQMRLANALCRLVELARQDGAGSPGHEAAAPIPAPPSILGSAAVSRAAPSASGSRSSS